MDSSNVRKKGEEGFTLLEVMVSLSILAVGILGVIGMFISSIGGNAQGRNMSVASNIAQSEMDRLQNVVVYAGMSSIGGGIKKADFIPYTVEYTTNSVSGFNMKRINVTVSWTVKGAPHKVQISSLRAKS